MAVKVSGLSTMLRSLETLANPGTIQGIAREAVRQGGVIVQERMTAAAPTRTDDVDGGNSNALKPGELKAGIELYVGKPDERGMVTASMGPIASVRHVARWIERGHRLVKGGYSKVTKTSQTRGPGKQIGFVGAKPFLRPAWEASKGEAAAAVVTEVQRQVRKIKSVR